MQVYLLLDQDVGEVAPLKVFPSKGKADQPVILTKIGEKVPSVDKSFQEAAVAVYNTIMNLGTSIDYSYYYYTIGDGVAKRIHGESGALACAIALMYEMLAQNSEQTIGATGVVDAAKGTIKRIEAINRKIAAAVDELPETSILFYPLENDGEIESRLREAAQNRDIRLRPVKTLDDVLDELQLRPVKMTVDVSDKVVIPPSWWTRLGRVLKRRPILIAMATILLAGYSAYALTSAPLALYLLESESYSVARWHINAAQWAAFFNGDLTQVSKDFETPLDTQSDFVLSLSTGSEEMYPVDRVPPEFPVSDRDKFAFRVKPIEPVYTYIIQSEGSGAFKRLYPPDPLANPVRSSKWIPDRGVYFSVQGRAGNRDIYMVLSRWRCKVLEKALFSLGQGFHFPEDMNKYILEEQSVQLKRVPITLEK